MSVYRQSHPDAFQSFSHAHSLCHTSCQWARETGKRGSSLSSTRICEPEFDWQLLAGAVRYTAVNESSMCGRQMMRFMWAGLFGSGVWQAWLAVWSCSGPSWLRWSLALLRRCLPTSMFTASVVVNWLLSSWWLALKGTFYWCWTRRWHKLFLSLLIVHQHPVGEGVLAKNIVKIVITVMSHNLIGCLFSQFLNAL